MKRDFLELQNCDGYATPFADAVVDVLWPHLDGKERDLLRLKKRTPRCPVEDRNRLMAIAACTHDPSTGLLRRHDGTPWGVNFIVRHVIGLNGTMRGTGQRAGNANRAVRGSSANVPVTRSTVTPGRRSTR